MLCLPRKTTLQLALTSWKQDRFCRFPHIDTLDTARPQENQRLETRHAGASKRAFRTRHPPIFIVVASKSTFSYEFSYEPQHLLPQNRCFLRGFRQFSAHLTKCHAHHAICTLSPLDAALTMRFAKNTQHDTSKVLRLPRKMTMEVAKVLHLPRKMRLIFLKRRKSISPLPHKTTFDTLPNTSECHEVPRLPRETRLHGIGNLQKRPLL